MDVLTFFQVAVDPTESVKSIGLSATLILIMLAGVGFIVRYFIKALDKRDAVIAHKDTLIKESHDARVADIFRLEQGLQEAASAIHSASENLRDGFDDLREEVRRK